MLALTPASGARAADRPTESFLPNLCAPRRLLFTSAMELGNQQSHIRPHGVMPGRLFACPAGAVVASHAMDRTGRHLKPANPGLTSGLPRVREGLSSAGCREELKRPPGNIRRPPGSNRLALASEGGKSKLLW